MTIGDQLKIVQVFDLFGNYLSNSLHGASKLDNQEQLTRMLQYENQLIFGWSWVPEIWYVISSSLSCKEWKQKWLGVSTNVALVVILITSNPCFISVHVEVSVRQAVSWVVDRL